MIYGIPMSTRAGSSCTKIELNGFEISIACKEFVSGGLMGEVSVQVYAIEPGVSVRQRKNVSSQFTNVGDGVDGDGLFALMQEVKVKK